MPSAAKETTMTTFFNGTEFSAQKPQTFAPTFEGAQARRERNNGSIIAKRTTRRARRANRAI